MTDQYVILFSETPFMLDVMAYGPMPKAEAQAIYDKLAAKQRNRSSSVREWKLTMCKLHPVPRKETPMDCPTCKGTGEVVVAHDGKGKPLMTDTCPACNGTGHKDA